MKKTLNVIGNILCIGMDVMELLGPPALFCIIGWLNSFPWPYYAITIGGYVALFFILERILHLIFKALGKQFTPLIERKLKKYCNDIEEKGREKPPHS